MDDKTATDLCLGLLAEGVPLTLLWDLAGGPAADSAELLATEPADTSWIPAAA